jgi:proline iminopeptidase
VPTLTTIDGRRLAWEESGSGPPLLCHPGGPGASARYFGALPELVEERALLLLDPRGTGASDRPADAGAYDLSDYAIDIETVREHLDLERLDLLGHSHGGFVAMTWASTYPDRVGRLVLTNTAPRFTDAIRQARQAIVAGHASEPWFPDALAALQAHQAGDYADDAELAGLLEREMRLFSPGWGEDEQAVAAAMLASGMNADALRHFNEHVAPSMDLRAGLARITAPTLVITGGVDPFGESTAREMTAALADAALVVVPDSGHFVFLESGANAWARAILDFLADERPDQAD